MNLVDAFKTFRNPSDNSESWRIFCHVFPVRVDNDPSLRALIAENALEAEWENTKGNYLMLLDHELMYLVFTYQDDIASAPALHQKILEAAQDTISKALTALLAPDINLSGDGGKKISDLHEAIDNILNDYQKIEQRVKAFSLNIEILERFLKTWDSVKTYDKLNFETPIVIKEFDYFDVKIYEVIKSTPELLKTLDWRIFEEMLADILKTFGYTVELTRKTKDGGIDIIAIRAEPDLGLHKYILQAKRSVNAIQVDPVRQLMYLHTEHNATKSIFATTATFTKGAKELAEKRHRWTLELKDMEGVLAWIDKVIAIKKRRG